MRIGELSKTTATGCGLLKNEPDPPLLPDDAYPAWLWKLIDPMPTVKELTAKYHSEGLNMQEVRGFRLLRAHEAAHAWRLPGRKRLLLGPPAFKCARRRVACAA